MEKQKAGNGVRGEILRMKPEKVLAGKQHLKKDPSGLTEVYEHAEEEDSGRGNSEFKGTEGCGSCGKGTSLTWWPQKT